MALLAGTSSSMTITVSDLFREYESDFQRLRREIDEQLETAKAGGNAQQHCASEAGQKAGRADQALRQMEMEARTLPPETRSHIDPLIRKYRSELRECQKAVDAARQAAEHRELFGLGPAGRDRERLLGSTDALSGASRQLGEAHRQSLETEQISLEVMNDLRQQREVIIRTRANVGEMGNQTALAQRLLGSMSRRALTNRYLVYVVAVLMVMMLIVAVYFTWKERPE